MSKKEKATTLAAQKTFVTQHKGSDLFLTCKVFEILKAGQKVTAIGLNQVLGFNDARKAISSLRAKGYPIMDDRLIDNRKVYYLPLNWERIMRERHQSDKQLELFKYD